jgi:GTP-binding protein HflX
MFERPSGGNRALLVSIDLGEPDFSDSLEELDRLASSAGAEVVATVTARRTRPDSATFAGSGKVTEIAECVHERSADLVIFNHQLSPAQQRNLEKTLQCRVVDRVSLILDIFALRAKSHEGKLQVELAQLEHMATRLVRGWSHLERQKGGIGLRGPGETQLETDRRLLGKRIKVLREKLLVMRKQRNVQRRSRMRANVFAVSLVGYTNAGKSTLFRALTGADPYIADQLFATLDTTTRRMRMTSGTFLVVSDTVGFIRQLPHTLVEAFRATLEDAIHADLLLHVVDNTSPVRDMQIDEVNKVLTEIRADSVPQLIVYNKIDGAGLPPDVARDDYGKIISMHISAKTSAGLNLLRDTLDQMASVAREARSQSAA